MLLPSDNFQAVDEHLHAALEELECVPAKRCERLDVQCADRLAVTVNRNTDLADDAWDRL